MSASRGIPSLEWSRNSTYKSSSEESKKYLEKFGNNIPGLQGSVLGDRCKRKKRLLCPSRESCYILKMM